MRITRAALVASASLVLGAAAVAAPRNIITVTSLFDNDTPDGLCTLREAITSANLDALYLGTDCVQGNGVDTINFASTGSILLNSSLPEIGESTVIEGPGASLLTIDGL